MSRDVATALLDVLVAAGVRQIFGIPGDAINGLVDAIRPRDDIEFVQVRHEESGAFAASAQAKLTGDLSVCVGTAGPGAIHLLNGLYDAKMDHAPVLAITGQVETARLGSRYHQEVDLDALFKDVAVFSETIVTPSQMPGLAVQAVRAAIGHRAVSHIALPADMATVEAEEEEEERAYEARHLVPEVEVAPCDSDLDRAADVLNGASAVTVMAGIGAAGAVSPLLQVADTLAAPIVKSLRAKDLLPDRHLMTVGGLGLLGTTAAVKAIDRSDVLLLVGTDFPYSEFYPDDVTVVQIDLDPTSIGRRLPVEVGLAGHSHLALEGLAPRLRHKEDRSHLEQAQSDMGDWRALLDAAESDDAAPLRPQRVAAKVGELASTDAVFVCDTGAVTVWAARHLDIQSGQRFILSSSLASMAFAVPGAIGSQIAFPDRQVIALIGDGGFTMLMSELLTAVDRQLPITVVVFNNSKLGLIQMEQEAEGMPEFKTGLKNPDFAEVARVFGAAGMTVRTPAELEPALAEALALDGPALIDVMVNPGEVVVPPKIEFEHVIGYATAKIKEMLGKGSRAPGAEPLGDLIPVVTDRIRKERS